jgi:hypothetical protein
LLSILKYILPASVVACYSCLGSGTKDGERAVAQVGMKFLYESEVTDNLPKDIDPSDSALFAQQFITDWIKQQLLTSEAEIKLSSKEKDVMAEIEKYRQELFIYKYQSARMNEVLDKKIGFDDVENYYYTHLDKFKLDRIIARVVYMIFPAEIDPPLRIKQKAISNEPEDINEVENYIYKNAEKYDNFNDDWIFLDNLLNHANYKLEDPEEYLLRNDWIEFRSGNKRHIVAIKRYMIPGQTAPLDFVSEQIKNTIINQRKLDFLREIKDSLYNDALKYNKFRVFN